MLSASDTPSAVIPSRECITTRHLLERTLTAVQEALEQNPNEAPLPAVDPRCENLSIFLASFQRLLQGRRKFVLVFDAIDRQREALPTLLPALARLSETIPHLTTVFVLTTPHPHTLHHAGVPHLHFPPYTRAETLSLATARPLPICTYPIKNSPDPTSTSPDSDSSWLWHRFVTATYDSLGASVARDIISFQTACHRLWPAFVAPILDKDDAKKPGDYWPREFSKLMVKNRPLFQSEVALVDSIVPVTIPPIGQTSSSHHPHHPARPTTPLPPPPLKLPYYASYLLIAAYLASYNPSRSDIPLLSKTAVGKKRKKGRGAGATANHTRRNALTAHRKISRRLLGPQPFGLERFFAIFRAIMSEEPRRYKGGSAELAGQFATLVELRLVVRAGGAAAGGDAVTGGGGGGKWRCGVGWELVRGVARGVGFGVEEYVVE